MFFIDIKLNSLRNTEIHQREVDGTVEDCISIPIRSNGLIVKKRREIHLYALMKERTPNPEKVTHYIVPYIKDKFLFSKLINTGWWKTMFYLGTAKKCFGMSEKKSKGHVSLDEAMER